MHPVWTAAADAIGRGGGGEGGRAKSEDAVVVRGVLHALWTRVIVHLSAALQVQILKKKMCRKLSISGALCSEYARVLTFENLCQLQVARELWRRFFFLFVFCFFFL